ncbi:HPr family phosphocarrier protein [Streptacidiphilus carbonis]|uniref:HPr family phosphocarrier protein n=1 Tax=Streptacidiphilus carbonis TaxID=105422 RepID=UPI0005A96081|nr:HPr family phosphocarrier protein [Streptacidiphilus carbonis]
MFQRSVAVGSSSGLHARPASLFVQAAARQPVRVTVAKEGGDPVDARSLLSVLALGARRGDTVVLSAEGPQAEDALDELAALVALDHDAAEQ